MPFINATDALGAFIVNTSNNLTGDLFFTLLLLVFGIILLCLALRVPTELSVVIVLPLLAVSVAYTSDMYPVLGVGILYLSFIVTKLVMRV